MTSTTHTLLQVDAPEHALSAFQKHIEADHEVTFETAPDGGRYVENAGFRIAFKVEDAGLRITISAPLPDMLVFIKEAVAKHVAELDADLARNLRWTGETAIVGDLPENFRVGEVTNRATPMQGLVRVTLKIADAAFFGSPGLHIKIMLPAIAGRSPSWPRMGANGAPIWPRGEDALHARYITIIGSRASDGEIDIDVAAHGDGLISSWAMNCEVGQQVGIMGPIGSVEIPDAETAVLAADLTALPTVARALAHGRFGPKAWIIGEAPDEGALRAYLGDPDLPVLALATDAFSTRLSAAAQEVMNGQTPDFAFFAGEFSDAQALRKVFKGTFGLGKGQQLSVPYWRHGTAGFED